MTDLDPLRPEAREAVACMDSFLHNNPQWSAMDAWDATRAELLRLADADGDLRNWINEAEQDAGRWQHRAEKAEAENARLNKVESRETERRLEMEDVELYLMDVSQPEDEGAGWCDRMKSAIEGLVQDCNEAVGQKNQAIQRAETVEAELAAVKARIAEAPEWYDHPDCVGISASGVMVGLHGKRVRLIVEE